MTISATKTIVCSPDGKSPSSKINIDQGFMLIGDATPNGRELAGASCPEDRPIPCLLGKDADRIEQIWQFFYRGVYGPARSDWYDHFARDRSRAVEHQGEGDIAETTDETGCYIERHGPGTFERVPWAPGAVV